MIRANDIDIRYIEHLVHFRNLFNVLKNGLVSHNEAYEKRLISEDISMAEIQERRHAKPIPQFSWITIHDCVPFYFNTKNPMLFKRKDLQEGLVILLISADIINTPLTAKNFAVFTDGNASSNNTRFYHGIENLHHLDTRIIYAPAWTTEDPEIKRENGRKRCAEVLIYPSVPVSKIERIICPSQHMLALVKDLICHNELIDSCENIAVEENRRYFF